LNDVISAGKAKQFEKKKVGQTKCTHQRAFFGAINQGFFKPNPEV
jgi:hypothetical protein